MNPCSCSRVEKMKGGRRIGGRRRWSIPALAPARLKVDGARVWRMEIFELEVLERATADEPEEVS